MLASQRIACHVRGRSRCARARGFRAQRQGFRAIADRIRPLPGIDTVAYGDTLPLKDFTLITIGGRVEERVTGPDQDSPIAVVTVSPKIFTVMGMRLIGGRAFTGADRPGTPAVAIVNLTLARQWWGSTDAIGRRIQIGGDTTSWTTIVGVVADVRHDGLDRPARPLLYQPFEQRPLPFGFVAVRAAADPEQVTTAIRGALRGLSPALAIDDVATMQARLAGAVSERRFVLTLIASLAVTAGVLAMIGLYGVLSGLVGERTREIGIRVALGAHPAHVRWLVLRHAAAVVAVGVGLGLVGAAKVDAVLRWLFDGIAHGCADLLCRARAGPDCGVGLCRDSRPAGHCDRSYHRTSARIG